MYLTVINDLDITCVEYMNIGSIKSMTIYVIIKIYVYWTITESLLHFNKKLLTLKQTFDKKNIYIYI